MVVFEDIEDVIDWLEPLDYLAFWEAIAPYDLTLQSRDHCDGLIAGGKVEPGVMLDGLKYLARLELAQRFGLNRRIYHPYASPLH